jgi:probable F420-dependent oxidoreductase
VREVGFGVAVSLTDRDVAVTEVARLVEQSGLESLFFTEHSHVPVSRGDLLEEEFHARHRRLLDQFTALGAAAAVTKTLQLGTAVCVVALHHPILLAKQVATIDHISQVRFLFGVAAGWLTEEMRNLGIEPTQRWELMGEHLEAMRDIWTHDEAEFHGRHVDFDPIWMWPKPIHLPYPPLLIGGGGPRSLQVAATYGDGWLPVISDMDEFDTQLTELRELCDRAHRPPLPITGCFDELDADLIASCLERGVSRCVVMAPAEEEGDLQDFLDRYASLRERIG